MMILQWVRFAFAVLLLLGSLALLLATVIGIFRLKYVLNRLHVAALTDTLGVFLMFLSLAVMFGLNIASLKLFLIIIFLWIANPLTSHLIAHLEVATNLKINEEYEVEPHGID